jgi:hypothetical protein
MAKKLGTTENPKSQNKKRPPPFKTNDRKPAARLWVWQGQIYGGLMKVTRTKFVPRKRVETQAQLKKAVDEAHRQFYQARGLHPPPVSTTTLGAFAYYKQTANGLKIARTF